MWTGDLGTYLISHGGREQHRLSAVGTQPDDFLHLLGEKLVQHPVQKSNGDKRILGVGSVLFYWGIPIGYQQTVPQGVQ